MKNTSGKKTILSGTAQTVIMITAAVLLNLGIVFSAVYILFHILEYYNPHTFVYSNLPWLPIAIPILFILSVLLYDLLFLLGTFKKRRINKAGILLIVLCDLVLFSAISAAIYLRTCTNPLVESNKIEEYTLPTPSSVSVLPTPERTVSPTETSEDPEAEPQEPTDVPTPEPTAEPEPVDIRELMEAKYPDKFSDPPVSQSYDKSNVVETLSDGTTKSLIYTYYGKNAGVEIFLYQKKKLQYQLAEIYVKETDCFKTAYSHSFRHNLKTQQYAAQVDAIVAANGDNFNSGKIEDGIIIRNGAQFYPDGGKPQTKFTRDLCVLFSDGTMRVYDCVLDKIDYNEILSRYPRQAFYFGPKLLNEDGTAKTKFNSALGKANPRTALGYYEPGHFGLVVVLGTREMIDFAGKSHGNGKSPGMTLTELSELCESLGFAAAYNLDGGGSSSMVWNKTVFGHNDRTHSDILAVVDP